MQVVASTPFLPRVNVVPRVVMSSAVGRALQSVYADMLQEPLPHEITALLSRLDEPAPTWG
jgi:Anti-sigma factor NepR